MQIKKYDESSIKHLEGLEQVRQKPGVFIGSIGPKGVYRLFIESIANVIDEFTAGHGKKMEIFIDSRTCEFMCIDHARGIPLGKFEEILCDLFTSGKYNKSEGPYKYSVGTNGVGLKAINALSEYLIVDTWRDGKHVHGEFSRGLTNSIVTTDEAHETGTIVKYKPDITVLEDISVNYEKYRSTVEISSYMNPGLLIEFTFNGKKETFYNENGIIDYFSNHILKLRKCHSTTPIITFRDKQDLSIQLPSGLKTIVMEYEIHFLYSDNIRSEIIESFCNGLSTINNGTHVTGFRTALTNCIKNFITKNNLLPKNSKLVIDGSNIRENLVALVSVKHNDPLYSTQIKEELTNQEMLNFIRSSIYKRLSTWLEDNQKVASTICNLVIRSAKAQAAAKEAKNNIIKAGTKLNFLTMGDMHRKYNGCKSNNPEMNELYIVEGDSAGGSAKDARNTENQAVFRIKGKIQNVIKGDASLSDELTFLIDIMNCGFGENFNINKLRFHKIIKATDADSDGSHISTLIDGFYFRNFPEIIERGYLYEASPPLYQLTFGKGKSERNVFIPTAAHFQHAITTIAIEAFDVISYNGGKEVKLSKELAATYINKLVGYRAALEQYAVQRELDPELLEFIIKSYGDILKGDFRQLEALDWECFVLQRTPSYMHININKIYEHYFIVLDQMFYENTYVPLRKMLETIYLTKIKFKNKETSIYYGGSEYRNAVFLENLLLGKGVHVRRIKGLGESTPEQLRYYMFNPKTRNLNRVRMADAQKAAEAFDIFLGKNIEAKKKLFNVTETSY